MMRLNINSALSAPTFHLLSCGLRLRATKPMKLPPGVPSNGFEGKNRSYANQPNPRPNKNGAIP